jgi:cold shock CspA family protein
VRGKMLWFNEAKDHGFIETDDGERLYVQRSGFLEGQAPVGRCAGLPVQFDVAEVAGDRTAVGASLIPEPDQRRAHYRRSRGR